MGDRQLIYKTSNTLRNNVTTVANDPTLIVALTSGGIYRCEFFVRWASIAAADFRYALKYSSTLNYAGMYGLVAYGQADNTTTVANQNLHIASTITAGTALDVEGEDGSTAGYVYSRGIICPSGNGTLSFQWAQKAFNPGDTTVYSGSYILLQRLDE